MADLPPGLLGYRAAVEDSQRKNALDLQNLTGLLSLQSQMEMRPLQAAQLRLALENEQRKQQAMKDFQARFQGGGQAGAPAPMAFGQGGISLPGGAQANMNTGQVVPAQQRPQGGLPYSPADLIPLQNVGVNTKPYLDIFNAVQPNIEWVNGVPVDKKTGQIATTSPSIPQINREGFGTQTIPDPTAPGGFRITVPPGSPEAYAQQRGITNRSAAQYDVVTVPPTSPNAPPTFRSRLDVLGGQPQGQPVAVPSPAGFPRITPQEQAQRDKEAAAIRVAEGQPGGGGMIPSSTVLPNAAGMSPLQKSTVEAGTAGAKTVNEGQAKIFNKNYDQALKGVQTLPVIQSAREALDKGAITGFAGDFRLNFGRALSAAGFQQSKNDVENTQVFASTMARQVLGIIKNLGSGSGISDADREYASKIVGGTISLDEAAIRRLMNISETAIKNQAKWVNDNVGQYSQFGGIAKPIDVGQFMPQRRSTDAAIKDAQRGGQAPRSGQIRFLGFE